MSQRWRKTGFFIASAAMAVTGTLVATVPAARAQTLPAGCTETFRVTCRYSYTGGAQQFMVPPKVTFLIVELIGAAGGHGCREGFGGGGGAAGAEVKGYIILPPNPTGTKLEVYVGGKGDDARSAGRYGCAFANGGFNGGGGGGVQVKGWYADGGGGGGASDIRDGTFGLGNRLAVAGGGGGGASGGANTLVGWVPGGEGGKGGALGDEGKPGENSHEYLPGLGGEGATPSSGGTGGQSNGRCTRQSGLNGRLGQGGSGGGFFYEANGRLEAGNEYCGSGGGGGGGGVYGGGGGGQGDSRPDTFLDIAGAGGGGGGSSAITNPNGSTIKSGVATSDGNGFVSIAYNVPK